VLRGVFNKATITMTDFLTPTMCLLGEPIALFFDTHIHWPILLKPDIRTNALSKLCDLQTRAEISTEKISTMIFPIPIDTIALFLKGLTRE
jgi:hypothetical protein